MSTLGVLFVIVATWLGCSVCAGVAQHVKYTGSRHWHVAEAVEDVLVAPVYTFLFPFLLVARAIYQRRKAAKLPKAQVIK